MTPPRPIDHGWWLASRSAGLVALLLVTFSVGVGLLMAGRVMRKPGLGKVLSTLHEQLALSALVAMAVHALTLLGDPFLHPGLRGVAVPFAHVRAELSLPDGKQQTIVLPQTLNLVGPPKPRHSPAPKP